MTGFVQNDTNNKRVSLAICGHVDSGKTSLFARLIYESGSLTHREQEKINKWHQQNCQNHGYNSCYSIPLQSLYYGARDEESRGVTITTKYREIFSLNSYNYTIFDVPGHRDFIKNTIKGLSMSDVAILVVPATRGSFETSIAKGHHKKGVMQGMTRLHARLCQLYGIQQLIVVVNKFDDRYLTYQRAEHRFNEIKDEVTKMLKRIGYNTKKIPFIPISAYKGWNIKDKSVEMDWYKGFKVKIKNHASIKQDVTGYTLIDALEKVIKYPKRCNDKALRVSVFQKFRKMGTSGFVVTGKIHQGTLKCGDKIRFMPCGVTAVVKSIEVHHRAVEIAYSGWCVGIGITLNGSHIQKWKKIQSGEVIIIDDKLQDSIGNEMVSEFEALVFVQQHPSFLYSSMTKRNRKHGYSPSLFVGTAHVPCELKMILWKQSSRTKDEKVYYPDYLQAGDQAQVIFELIKPVFITSFEDCEPYGRIALMDDNTLVILGKVLNQMSAEDFEFLVDGYSRLNCHCDIPVDIRRVIFMFTFDRYCIKSK